MKIGDRIRQLRNAKGWKQHELAKLAGVEPPAVSMWETSKTEPETSRLPGLAAAFGLTLAEFMTGVENDDAVQQLREKISRSDDSFELKGNIFHTPERVGIKDLPIYAAVRGSFEGTFIDMVNKVEWQERPYYLEGVKEAFGILVVSDSMEPAFVQGTTLFVNPNHPCQIGDYVVVEIAEHQGMVKRLAKRSSSWVELEQFNPPGIKRFEKTEIVAMFKVVGSKFR